MTKVSRKTILWIAFFLCSFIFLYVSADNVDAAETTGDKSSVTVYFTLSDDGRFVKGNDKEQTLLSHVPITVDYFDLKEYGLETFYRYDAEPPEEGGEYTGDEVLKQPTLLHLYIKALEKYYLDGNKLEINTDALTITGTATSMYMTSFWGHDENLMYYVDHKYPLMRAGWGATADYILLEDGMEIDVAMFTDWSFYHHGAFAYFSPTMKTVNVNEEFTLQMLGAPTSPVADGEDASNKIMENEEIVYSKAEETFGGINNDKWEKWKDVTDSTGHVTLSFNEPGRYYVSSTSTYETFKDENNPDAECVAPPIAVITVEGTSAGEDDTGTENLTVLKDLYFTDTVSSETRYEMTPEFDSSTTEYTVYVPEHRKAVSIKSQVSDEASSKNATSYITAKYVNNEGKETEKTNKAGGKAGMNLLDLIPDGEEDVSLAITTKCGKSSQQYKVNIVRTPILSKLEVKDADGNPLSMDKSFSQDEKSYSVKVTAGTSKIIIGAVPLHPENTVTVAGQPVSDGTSEFTVDSSGEAQIIHIEVSNKNGRKSSYDLTLNFAQIIDCTFTNLSEGTVVQLLDAENQTVFRGKAAENDSEMTAKKLIEGKEYKYNITKKGYKGKSETIIADSGNMTIDGALEKAKENTSIDKTIPSMWPNFRGNNENNAVTAYKTPVKSSETQLYWAVRNGGGWSGSPSSPIIVDDYLVFSTNSEIVKVDKTTGEIKARNKMIESSAFSITSPTYGDGMVFIALANGMIQAFDADTLESLWVYKDALKGQPNSPITYHNGYIYTGFWNNSIQKANYVCLSVTDEDPDRQNEMKNATWTHAHAGGFYWAGSYVTDKAVIVGSDNGVGDTGVGNGTLYSFDPETGEIIDRIDNIEGDIRSTVSYDKTTKQCCFTSKGGAFYMIKLDDTGAFSQGTLRSVKLSGSKETPSDDPNNASGQCSSTPVVSGGRAYIGVSGKANLGAYTGHNITVIDLENAKAVYSIETRGYPQTSGLLTTAYNDNGSQYNYVYFIENYTPGILRVIKDKKGQTKPEYDGDNIGILGENEDSRYADTLFTPRAAQAEYAICSPVVDENGTIYFKNDSAYMMAVGSKIKSLEITQMPDKKEYEAGETFDPTGMRVAAKLANGLTQDVTKYVTYSKEPLTKEDLEIEISYEYVMYNDKEKKSDIPAAYIPISSIDQDEIEAVRNVNHLIEDISSAENNDFEKTVQAARKAYDELGAILQKYVKNKDILVEAEQKIAEEKLAAGGKTQTLKAAATGYNTVKLTWSRNSNAEGYEIYRSTSSKDRGNKIKTVGKDMLTMSAGGLATGTTYYFTVRPYINVDGNPCGNIYSKSISCKPSLKATKLKASPYTYNGVKLTWGRVSGANGYVIVRYNSSKKAYTVLKTITRGETLSYVNKSLYTGTKYIYKIKPYRTVSGKKVYGAYSSTVSATPKLSAVTKFKALSGKKKATLSWKKVSGASGYVIYRSTKSKSGFKALKTIKSSKTVKYTNTGLKKGKTYYYKMRAYRTVKGKKVYSAYTTVKKAKVK